MSERKSRLIIFILSILAICAGVVVGEVGEKYKKTQLNFEEESQCSEVE